MEASRPQHGIRIPDRQLVCAPVASKEGRAYLAGLAAAGNFAWANRQSLGHIVRGVAARVFGVCPEDVRTVYDVAHNIARVESHGATKVVVHRKGATRALGPDHPDLPSEYAGTGQPVFVPGRLGAASWVLAGVATSAARSWSTACHGVVSVSDRATARLAAGARSLFSGHADVDHVVGLAERAGLARRVARLQPMAVIKG
jgi:tRNA-splicing ligase RtcB